jgi:abequosyltransferase
MNMETGYLLTIAIPTWKRAEYLRLNLRQLKRELQSVPAGTVEIVVSDNCSPDHTGEVVRQAVAEGMTIRYVRNAENLGWGRNFFQCFNLAQGHYVWILGDDDLPLDGTLRRIVRHVQAQEFGVICIRPYGYDHDFLRESPGTDGGEKIIADGGRFLEKIGALATMISAIIVNKRQMGTVDTDQLFCGDLAHLHLTLIAALRGGPHLFVDRALIACKRNNSATYKFSKIFVQEYWQLMDSYVPAGMGKETIRRIENRLLFSYYPFYLLQERLADNGDHRVSEAHFSGRFGSRLLYRWWVAPILTMPRPLALAWAGAATAIGRAMGGELRRGIVFAMAKFRQRISNSPSPSA